MRTHLKTMSLRYSSGAISKMLIINIILAILIISALNALLNVDEQTPPITSSKPAAIAAKANSVDSAEQANTQSEIDALKKQLELETSKLGILREDKKRIEAIREASDAASAELDTPEIDTDNGADDAPVEKSTE